MIQIGLHCSFMYLYLREEIENIFLSNFFIEIKDWFFFNLLRKFTQVREVYAAWLAGKSRETAVHAFLAFTLFSLHLSLSLSFPSSYSCFLFSTRWLHERVQICAELWEVRTRWIMSAVSLCALLTLFFVTLPLSLIPYFPFFFIRVFSIKLVCICRYWCNQLEIWHEKALKVT